VYYEYFHLKEHPFLVANDVRYFYASPEHAHALAMMEYALIKKQGLMLLTGAPGAGKTILLKHFLSRIDKNYQIIRLDQILLPDLEFLQYLVMQLGQQTSSASKRELVQLIRQIVQERHDKGDKLVLVVDDAHDLAMQSIIDIIELSQLHGEKGFYCTIYLIGNDSLLEKLNSPALSERIQTPYSRDKLGGMSEDEIKNYILHRLSIAGSNKAIHFDDDVFSVIETYTGGSPRQVNILVDHMLTTAYLADTHDITIKISEIALGELQWLPHGVASQADAEQEAETPFQIDRRQSYKLIIKCKKSQKNEFLIRKKKITIGRHSSNDISIDDPLISRVHAQVLRQGRIYYIRDLDSKNGTFIDKKRIDIAPLKEDTKVRIGDCVFMLVRAKSRDTTNSLVK